MSDLEISIRDFLAIHANEEDIQSVKHLIPEIQKVRKSFSTSRVELVWGIPDNWRQRARYIHADCMIEARNVK